MLLKFFLIISYGPAVVHLPAAVPPSFSVARADGDI